MKRFWNILFQVGAVGTQLLNLYVPFIPPKYVGMITGILTTAQGTAAVVAHNYNPDGTPAEVPYSPPSK